MPMVVQMIKAFVDCGVSIGEMEMWDKFVLAWAWEYVRKGATPLDDDVQLVLVEWEKPPMPPQMYALLECIGCNAHPCHFQAGEWTGDEQKGNVPIEDDGLLPIIWNPLGLPSGGSMISQTEGMGPSQNQKKKAARSSAAKMTKKQPALLPNWSDDEGKVPYNDKQGSD